MATILHRLRQPEYTGENRCLPCTSVNLLIAVAFALASFVGADLVIDQRAGIAVSVAVFALSVLAIYLRGYLVPGTPELTKRYFPPWLLQLFGKDETASGGLVGTEPNAADGSATDDAITDVDPEQYLTAAGALEPCPEVDDLCLADDFAADWRASIRETRNGGTDRAHLFSVLDAEDLDPTFEERGDAFWARDENGRRIGTWESKAAFYADVAAAPLLAERLAEWDDLSVRARGQLLNGLRLFLETCPDCDADLSFATETVESCCSTHDVAAVSCEACGARLFESDPL